MSSGHSQLVECPAMDGRAGVRKKNCSIAMEGKTQVTIISARSSVGRGKTECPVDIRSLLSARPWMAGLGSKKRTAVSPWKAKPK